jgi:hypothetical protein
MKNIFKTICISLVVLFVACKKDTKSPEPTPTPTPAQLGNLQIEFENMVDTLDLVFGQKYVNPKLDTFQVTMFRYYISNIVVTKDDNTTFTEPNSYHLIDHAVSSTGMLTLTGLPAGSYKSVSFVLGVDSARNNSGAQTGELDPAKGMFWSWSSGYIFMKFEGTSPKSGDALKKLTYHVGGFSGVNKAQRTFNLSFGGATANVSSTANPKVHLSVNVNELFKTPNLIDVTTQYIVHMPGAMAKTLADNYSDMITFEHVHN